MEMMEKNLNEMEQVSGGISFENMKEVPKKDLPTPFDRVLPGEPVFPEIVEPVFPDKPFIPKPVGPVFPVNPIS